MGAPSTLGEIQPFLYRLFSDPYVFDFHVPSFLQKFIASVISRLRALLVEPHYRAIGNRSPLVRHCLEQAKLLEESLGIPTFVGMLYSEPLLDKVAEKILKQAPRLLYVLTLYPHYSRATVGACLRDAEKLLGGKVSLGLVHSWCLNPYYIEWVARQIEGELKGSVPDDTLVIFSAHSLPKYMVEKLKDPYPEEVYKTASAVMGRFPEFGWTVSYQSKVGPVKWLEPTTETALKDASRKGIKKVVVFPISFVSEHIETLYELDIEYARLAKELKLDYRRVRLNHRSPLLIKALAQEVQALREGRRKQ